LPYTLLGRIDAIVAMAPDYVNILIGTNDINAVLQPKHHYYKLRKIDKSIIPNVAAYRANLHEIIGQLKTKTTAYLSVMSLPVISEDLDHPANLKADQYSEIIREVALQEGIVYLPLREKQKDFLLKNPQNSQIKYEQTPSLIQKSALLHYVFKKSWDEITTKHGNLLTFDNLHLNAVGGGMIGNLIRAELANVPAIK
jgi:lysophospholipase L1-like esterase